MKRRFLAPIASIISALASENSTGNLITEVEVDPVVKHESDFSIPTHKEWKPFVLKRPEDSVFVAAHRSHSSHSSHYSGSGSSGSTYSPSYGSPSTATPSHSSHYSGSNGTGSTYSPPSNPYLKYSPPDSPKTNSQPVDTTPNLPSPAKPYKSYGKVPSVTVKQKTEQSTKPLGYVNDDQECVISPVMSDEDIEKCRKEGDIKRSSEQNGNKDTP